MDHRVPESRTTGNLTEEAVNVTHAPPPQTSQRLIEYTLIPERLYSSSEIIFLFVLMVILQVLVLGCSYKL